jgi:hypothetical protein
MSTAKKVTKKVLTFISLNAFKGLPCIFWQFWDILGEEFANNEMKSRGNSLIDDLEEIWALKEISVLSNLHAN